MSNSNKRRDFLKKTMGLGALATLLPPLTNAGTLDQALPVAEGDGYTILFQGDSITDGNRTRNNDWNHVMGHGYAYLISSRLWYERPKQNLHFFNRGISGNKVTDLAARWEKDTIALKPDLLSILIGINDTSAFINGGATFTPANYETGYRALLQQSKQQLPGVQFVLCEPFVLPVGKVKEQWSEYSAEVSTRSAVVSKLAREFDAIYVPFQSAFDKALTRAPAEYWIWDGIHPMPAGHELMARTWIKHVGKKITLMK